MFLNTSCYPRSQLVSYLNGFRVDPAAGALRVSRLDPHDIDPLSGVIRPERFRERQVVQFVEEVEEVAQGLRDRFQLGLSKSDPGAVLRTSAWNVRAIDKDAFHLSFEGLEGRSMEVIHRPETLSVKVGYESRDRRHELDAHLSLTIFRGDTPKVSSAYEIGFGSGTFDGLLRFFGLELDVPCLEWMSRRKLWGAIRERLERDGHATNGYDGDHLGLAWRSCDRQGKEMIGRLWTDDCYPSLHLWYPSGLGPLAPSFLPLWNGNVARIRAIETRPVRKTAVREDQPNVNA
jgi:hypothetical protein